MRLPKELLQRFREKYGPKIDMTEQPEFLEDLVEEVTTLVQSRVAPFAEQSRSRPPFGVSWMDSWVAHWVYGEKLRAAERQEPEVAEILRSLVDLKFQERLGELQRFVRDQSVGPVGPESPDPEPPDAGPPEPGVPDVVFEPPDAGPPEPGTPPAGPAVVFEPPDAGPPEPGVPPGPTGPDAGFLRENPWILYWFVSIEAPMLLDVIDAHLTRRLDELSARLQ